MQYILISSYIIYILLALYIEQASQQSTIKHLAYKVLCWLYAQQWIPGNLED